MYRGTTPSLTFNLGDFDVSEITKLKLTFAQSGNIILEKDLTQVVLGTGTITVNLTQEETIKLSPFRTLQAQIRFLEGTSAFTTNVVELTVSDILNDEVL